MEMGSAGNAPHPAKNLDLANFLLFGGRTRKPTDWRAMLDATGFDLVRIVETPDRVFRKLDAFGQVLLEDQAEPPPRAQEFDLAGRSLAHGSSRRRPVRSASVESTSALVATR